MTFSHGHNRFEEHSFKLKPHHHVRLDREFKLDCKVWLQFLEMEGTVTLNNIVNHPMTDILSHEVTSTEICFYSDASASKLLSYGCIYNTMWIQGFWDPGFIERNKPSIEYLELFALTAGIFTWQTYLADCRFTIFCDNTAVVAMINNMVSSCKSCMVLLRLLVLNGLKYNRRLRAKYVSTKNNFLADSLSRGQMDRFHKLGPQIDRYPHHIHSDIWPMSKLWLN